MEDKFDDEPVAEYKRFHEEQMEKWRGRTTISFIIGWIVGVVSFLIGYFAAMIF